jgi:K+-sensing histidine kinase KdpD
METLKNEIMNSQTILAGMSHEMRTYMNAIVAFSFLMQESSFDNEEREEFSNHIFNSCEQLMQLFDSFFESVRIDAGNSATKSKICKVDNILDDLVIDFRRVIRKDVEKNIELLTDIRIDPSARALIDTKMIERVIRSLFLNSLKNTTSGYIKIGLFSNDDQLTFFVTDTGRGYSKCKDFLNSEDINESLLKHDDIAGAININLIKKIISIMRGTIRIEHNDIEGTGIYFSVPAKIFKGYNSGLNEFVYSTAVSIHC